MTQRRRYVNSGTVINVGIIGLGIVGIVILLVSQALDDGEPAGPLDLSLELSPVATGFESPVFIAGAWAGLLGLASISAPEAGWWVATAAAAVVGHVFPVWLKFRGGKGVATAFGALMGVWPVLTIASAAGIATWVVITATTRFVSLGSVGATLAMTWYAMVLAVCFGIELDRGWPMVAVVGALALLVLVRHRGNLRRVLEGTEGRVGG